MIDAYVVSCPYCGESFETTIDVSIGSQQYIEDCYVCCQPINFVVTIGLDNEIESVETRRDDE